MRNFFNLHRFGYSVNLHVDVNSLVPYLSRLYEEIEIDEHEASECVYSAVNEIPVSYRVRVYDNHSARDFRDECHIETNWTYSMVTATVDEIKAMSDNEYMFFSDDRDELVQMVNDITDHCKEMGFHGEFSKIMMHTCPIDYGYRAF